MSPSKAVKPLWIAWAAARPPDSKPSPLRSVLASITFSTADVTACFSTALKALIPSANKTSLLLSPIA